MIQRLSEIPLLKDERLGYVALILGVSALLMISGERLVSSPAQLGGLLVLFAAIIVGIVNFRLALFIFTGFLFAYEEFNLTSQQAFVEENIENTVLAVKVFGLALMDILSLLLLLPVVVREWRHAVSAGRIRIIRADLWLLPVLLVWVFGMITGWFNRLSFSAYTWDLRMLGHVLLFYFIYSRTFTTRSDYVVAVSIAAAVFLLKQSVFMWRWLSGAGLDLGQFRRVLLGSDLPLTALFLCLSVTAWILLRRREGAYRHLALGMAAYFTVMLVAGLGKLTYIQTAYSLLLIYLLHRGEVSGRGLLLVTGTGAAAALLVYTFYLPEGMREAAAYALTVAFNWVDALKLYGDLSFGTRLLEAINVWAVLQREGALLWGLGWGAPWSEIAIHLPFDGGAFDIEEQYSGIHVQTHIDVITFMLKVGIIGTLIIYWSLLRFCVAAVRLYRGLASPAEQWTLMAIILMILIFLPNFLYFIRLKYLLGFALAGAAVFYLHDGAPDARDSRIADTHDTQ